MENIFAFWTKVLGCFITPKLPIPMDKQMHFWGGLIIALIAGISFGAWWGFTVCYIVAFGKEFYDWLHKDKHTPDVFDALATVLGGGAGFFLINIFM